MTWTMRNPTSNNNLMPKEHIDQDCNFTIMLSIEKENLIKPSFIFELGTSRVQHKSEKTEKFWLVFSASGTDLVVPYKVLVPGTFRVHQGF